MSATRAHAAKPNSSEGCQPRQENLHAEAPLARATPVRKNAGKDAGDGGHAASFRKPDAILGHDASRGDRFPVAANTAKKFRLVNRTPVPPGFRRARFHPQKATRCV